MKSPSSFRSLQMRLLAPLIGCALLAALAVALGSYWLGTRWATEELTARFAGIRKTLANSQFPLNSMVLTSLADLTQTEMVALDAAGRIRQSTLSLQVAQDGSPSVAATATWPAADDHAAKVLPIDGRMYRAYAIAIEGGAMRADRVHTVVVLFDEEMLQASQQRAALLPLATGLSTILALSSITLPLTTRLVRRIGQLRLRVEAVAQGDFASRRPEHSVADQTNDELGRLGEAVDSMAVQLNQLWQKLHRQQSEKLLHQIAGGMAHQLRNSLTGARMAVELHARDCQNAADEGVAVAIHQIELAEDYVRRLLLVASGRQDQDRPADVLLCWQDVRASLSPIAKHLRIPLQWSIDDALAGWQLRDGPTWVAAVTNLIHNALQAGDEVRVVASLRDERSVCVTVSDNGPGVAESVGAELFEPFVTSKPEGMGLGLPVVRRAAEYLQGQVDWRRRNGRTEFVFTAAVTAIKEAR